MRFENVNRLGERLRVSAFGILLAPVLLAMYFPGLRAPFYMDDHGSIVNNPAVHFRPGEASRKAVALFRDTGWLAGRPLAYFSFGLNHLASGLSARAFRGVNLVLHWATAVVLAVFVSLLYRRIGNSPVAGVSHGAAPFLAAALWAAHPTATQTVTYIVQRMNGGMAFFALLSCVFFLSGIDSRRRIWWTIACIACGILSLGFKQNALLLPFLWFTLLLYTECPPAGWGKYWHTTEVRLWIAAFTVLLAAAIFHYCLNVYPSFPSLVSFGALEGGLTQFRVVPHYLSLYILPIPGRLHLNYSVPLSASLWSPATTFFGLLFFLAWGVGIVYTFRRDRIISFGMLWFLVANLLESTILPLDIASEHRLYLPSIGLVVAAVRALSLVRDRLRVALPGYGGYVNASAVVFMALTLILWSSGTYARNQVWANPERFWDHEYETAPGNPNVVNERMNRLIERAEYDSAIREGSIALSGPTSPRERRMLMTKVAVAFGKKGNWEAALALLDRAVSVQGASRYEMYALGVAEYELGRLEAAEDQFRQLLRVDPEDPTPLLYLGRILTRRGKDAEALQALGGASRLDPGNVDALLESEAIYVRRKDWAEAARLEDKVAALSPPGGNLERHLRAGEVYFRSGNLGKAEAEYLQFLRVSPSSAAAHYNLACVYTEQGEYEKAAIHLGAALQNGHDAREMYADPDLDRLRGTKYFRRMAISLALKSSGKR